jgi:hypothetical protein
MLTTIQGHHSSEKNKTNPKQWNTNIGHGKLVAHNTNDNISRTTNPKSFPKHIQPFGTIYKTNKLKEIGASI